MQFYKMIVTVNAGEENIEREIDRSERRQYAEEICQRSEEFYLNNGKQAYFIVYSKEQGKMSVCVFANVGVDVSSLAHSYLAYIDVASVSHTLSEITFDNATDCLSSAVRYDFIEDADQLLEKLELITLARRMSFAYSESIISERAAAVIKKEAKELCVDGSVIPELNRIYASAGISLIGHPVHYMVETDDNDVRRRSYKMILDALYSTGRLRSKRYVFLNLTNNDSADAHCFEALYKTSEGGAVVVRYELESSRRGNDETVNSEVFSMVGSIARRYCNSVLTVVCIPNEYPEIKREILKSLDKLCIVPIFENRMVNDAAKEFLTSLAKSRGVEPTQLLLCKVDSDRAYVHRELCEIFEEWYCEYIKENYFTEYKSIPYASQMQTATPERSSAYDELQSMVGLTEMKRVITKAVNYHKMQSKYEECGVKRARPAMHMLFTGNPGTAKTTVARLFARIMKDNGVLSRGHLVEVGRSELVGKHVGWTAPTVKEKFNEARGGVLFIDEAYSLVDDRDGSYGDEAITTIVQEMENHRNDVAVIFAGYPDKMQEFLDKNPGLRSRIAFHVPFDDYSVDELCRIARHMASKTGMSIGEDAMEKLAKLFAKARTNADFGNGRYVRNILEDATMNQANRLVNLEINTVTKEQLVTITAEDIVVPAILDGGAINKIGFC